MAALPRVAAELGVDDDLLLSVQAEYEEHARAIRTEDNAREAQHLADARDLSRRLRLGVLEQKRRAVVELRDRNRIDDIVLRELQAAMDLQELRLLGPAPTD